MNTLTRDGEVQSFISYCARLGIEVIPLQQCFGHVEYILRHERYAHLRGEQQRHFASCARSRRMRPTKFSANYWRTWLHCIPSKYIHIGGDETYLLGHCEDCRAKAGRDGKSKLYVDYLRKSPAMLLKLGPAACCFGPTCCSNIRKLREKCPCANRIFVDWNYGWKPNFFWRYLAGGTQGI